VRIDAGVDEGDEIGPHYDPMIAKLVVWDGTRERALARMRSALAQLRIVGVANNVEFLARLVASPAFASGDLDTGLIERERDFLFPATRETPDEAWLLAALAELEWEKRRATPAAVRSPWDAFDGWRLNSRASRTLTLRLGEVQQDVTVEYAAGGYVLGLGGRRVLASGEPGSHGEFRARIGERRVHAAVIVAGERRHVFFEGRTWPIVRVDASHAGGAGEEPGRRLTAPMPGKVIALLAEPGKRVEQGAGLLVLEAMKMEHTIKAPRAGVVKAFPFAPGEQVSEGVELVEFEAEGA
jgi:3-methylcrotonyl-CoA carboxylase alpha subunit